MTSFRLEYHGEIDSEIRWIADVLFHDFLGQKVIVERDGSGACKGVFRLSSEGRSLLFADVFLTSASTAWLALSTLPAGPVAMWDSSAVTGPSGPGIVPVLYGRPACHVFNDEIRLGADLIGGSFFLLSRYEEAVVSARDRFDRFPAAQSIAAQEGFLHRPIVNEYLEIIWACMTHLWPGLQRPARQFRTLSSCDVDYPYSCGTKSLPWQLRQIGADLLLRRSSRLAFRSAANFVCSRYGDYRFDPYLPNIDWMMDVNEDAGLIAAFYFICGRSHSRLDGCYNIDEPIIRELLSKIARRGHEIGLHPSFNTYLDAARLRSEADNLRRALAEEGITQSTLGGRQHFLRWRTASTAQCWEAAGLDYDSTLSYSERAGFRCSTCYEYDFFDVVKRKPLTLRERPLIVMEASVLSLANGNLQQAFDTIVALKRTCATYRGDFTLLWHNSNLQTAALRELYHAVLTTK
ncbi:MAG: polysaccharide deacetylase family protein [Rhizobiales bacterium]|nr:polysaccharide deacetylase family protein [Hyphomicrobiales bacterium]